MTTMLFQRRNAPYRLGGGRRGLTDDTDDEMGAGPRIGATSPTFPPGTPVYVPVSSGGNSGNAPYWWDGALSVFSQAISAYSGQNSGTQVITSGNRVTAITNPVAVQPTYDPRSDPRYYQQNGSGSGGIGNDLGTGVQGLLNTVLANPLYLLGGGIALYLLFRPPPGSKKA